MLLRFEGRGYSAADGESVLDCLERHGVAVDSHCRNGACQTCLLKADSGEIPAAAQQGVKESWRRLGYFLACVCRPTGTLEVSRCDAAREYASAVLDVRMLGASVLLVRLARPPGFEYDAGQFVQLIRPGDGLMRPFSIASLPSEQAIELHVALLAEGRMSQWLRGATGEPIRLRGPFGECSYQDKEPDRPLLLAGTGTGLAPLLGVLRSALAAGHRAPIRLFHGAVRRDGLYLWQSLRDLQASHPQLAVHGSVLDPEGLAPEEPDVLGTPLEQQVLGLGDAVLSGQRVYLCGRPELVHKLRREVYLAGVPFARIHADPFLEPARQPSAG